jgi:hypothetical protein
MKQIIKFDENGEMSLIKGNKINSPPILRVKNYSNLFYTDGIFTDYSPYSRAQDIDLVFKDKHIPELSKYFKLHVLLPNGTSIVPENTHKAVKMSKVLGDLSEKYKEICPGKVVNLIQLSCKSPPGGNDLKTMEDIIVNLDKLKLASKSTKEKNTTTDDLIYMYFDNHPNLTHLKDYIQWVDTLHTISNELTTVNFTNRKVAPPPPSSTTPVRTPTPSSQMNITPEPTLPNSTPLSSPLSQPKITRRSRF